MHFAENDAPMCYLDRMRLQSDGEQFKNRFLELAKEHREQAVLRLNADHLHFATLFLLLPEINTLNCYDALNKRNRAVVTLLTQISTDCTCISHAEPDLLKDEPSVHAALRWIIQTGIPDDGQGGVFDQILDTAACLLLRSGGDTDLLPGLVRLLFRRNRKGQYIHDLVWAIFQSQNPDCLRLAARYLRSPNKKDVSLARTLLRYNGENDADAPKQWRYASFASWFQENRPYLRFTGDTFNRTSMPALFRVDLDAKYRAVGRPSREQGVPNPPTQGDAASLEAFHRATVVERQLLASYSHRLHARDEKRWQKWMARPVEEQIRIAQSGQRERL